MIGYLAGKIKLARAGFLIVDVNGVGYKVITTPQMALLESGNDSEKKYEFFIHHHTKEDASDLYGFLTFQELELFEKLLSVNGVGPKAAMTIVGLAPVDKIIEAILSEDQSFFQSASGIGKKVALKIIIDLKSKISNIEFSGSLSNGIDAEVFDALISLGYKKMEIEKVSTKMPKDLTRVEDQVRWCLKHLAKS